ncbi:uncharacterized protein DUF1624 [Anaerospora hongkongensis]|uniref:Uncharacterized protein DUF1624 n=1 Tax=Anaerospora hongkongensis TaxID=244830 RepID=A0A4R1PZ91_9FIRM|nr:heparan-alpha-glucosaminide N-acetyltransferase domain-containing protein [Anaerospora hongkongensis]TCL36871.1 uncharacterized protein DUF1624 [Anaerospora hongkongensis]
MKNRDSSIDSIRGLAVFTMVAANMVPDTLQADYPEWFRFYGTFSAPIFIFLSGMMVAITRRIKEYHFKYYLARGFAILLIGVLIDVFLWRIYPFMTYDILYLIGLAIPLCYILGKIPKFAQYLVAGSILFLTPIFHKIIKYREFVDSFYIKTSFAEVLSNSLPLKSLFIDGWFPVFPWLGIAFLGYFFGNVRLNKSNYLNKITGVSAFLTLTIGIILWNTIPVSRYTRAGYIELFYPPDLSFVFIAVGVILSVFLIVDRTYYCKVYIPFRLYGCTSLLLYIIHLIIINVVFIPLSEQGIKFEFKYYYLVYLGVMIILLGVALGVKMRKIEIK